jgi:hypothetical protein
MAQIENQELLTKNAQDIPATLIISQQRLTFLLDKALGNLIDDSQGAQDTSVLVRGHASNVLQQKFGRIFQSVWKTVFHTVGWSDDAALPVNSS